MGKISFYLKDPTAGKKTLKKSDPKSTKFLIMMRIYDSQFSSGRFIYSTKEHIEPKNWDAKTQKAKQGFDHINTRLHTISKSADRYIADNRQKLTRRSLKDHLDSGRPKEIVVDAPKLLLTVWKEYLEVVKGNVSKRTYRGYNRSYEVMDEFLRLKKLKPTPEQFDRMLYNRYITFLKEKYPSNNTVSRRLKNFKMMVNFTSIELGFDAKEIKSKETSGLKISLKDADLKKLVDLRLEDRLARTRDLMIVQSHTGVRVGDLFRLDKCIVGDKFELQQEKTLKIVSIPILPPVRAVLERYNYSLPHMSSKTYNENIKLVFKELDDKSTIQIRDASGFKNVPVWKQISSHDLVRTFITVSASKDVPITSIAQIVGKTIGIIQKHYVVDNQKQAEKDIIEKWTTPVQVAV